MDTPIRPVSVVLLLGTFGDGVGVSARGNAPGAGHDTEKTGRKLPHDAQEPGATNPATPTQPANPTNKDGAIP